MIQEDYISFETAKLLKKKGFDEPTLAYAYSDDMISYYSRPRVTDILSVEAGRIPLPTLQMAMKWLREIHKKWITVTFHWHTVDRETTLYYSPYIMLSEYENVVLEDKNPFKMKLFNSYEEACDAAIKYCLENLI